MNGLGLDPDASTQQPLGEREEYALDRSPVHRRTHTHTHSHTSGLFTVCGLQQETGGPRETHIGENMQARRRCSPWNPEGSDLIRSSSVVMTSSKMETQPDTSCSGSSTHGEGMEPIRDGCLFNRWDLFRMCL